MADLACAGRGPLVATIIEYSASPKPRANPVTAIANRRDLSRRAFTRKS